MCHVLRTSRSCLGSRRSRCLGTWCPVPPRNRSDLSVRRRSTFACARKARRALPLCSGDQHSPTTREPSPPRWPIVRYLCLILLTCHRLRLGSSQRAERRRAVEFRSVATVVTSRMHKVDAGFDRSLADEACAAVLDGKPSRTVRRRGDLQSLTAGIVGASFCSEARTSRYRASAERHPCSAVARDALARFRDSCGLWGRPDSM